MCRPVLAENQSPNSTKTRRRNSNILDGINHKGTPLQSNNAQFARSANTGLRCIPSSTDCERLLEDCVLHSTETNPIKIQSNQIIVYQILCWAIQLEESKPIDSTAGEYTKVLVNAICFKHPLTLHENGSWGPYSGHDSSF